MIIAFVNAKGGVGKTTLAVHLAAWLGLYDISVTLIDCDGQRLSSFWMSTAKPDMDVYTVENGDEFSRKLPGISKKYDAVVIDAPGGLSEIAGAILHHADAALIPTGTSGLDMEGVHWTAATIKQIQEARNELPESIVESVESDETRKKYLLPNTAIIPVQAEEGRIAMKDLRDFSKSLSFGMTTSTLPGREIHKQITPKRAYMPGKENRPGRLIWQMGKSKIVRDAALDIDSVFQEIFPEICQDDPNLVMRMVTPKSRWHEMEDRNNGIKIAANG